MAKPHTSNDSHILKSIQQINQSTWLIGNLILRRLTDLSTEFTTWEDDDGSKYIVSVAPKPLPVTTRDANTPHITLIHEAGDASAVWSIGNNAILKARYTLPGITSESTTLQYVQKQNPSFATPTIIYHAFDDDRNYLLLRRLPGITLYKIWPSLNDHWRKKYVNEIVRLIREMEQWKGALGGVDGQGLLENWLLVPKAERDYTPKNLQSNCEALGMDCSESVFFHADLAPTNVLVKNEPMTGEIGLIDFELAGFFPRPWIRTKFSGSWAFDLDEKLNPDPRLYRTMMVTALGAYGYENLVEAWRQRRKQVNRD